MRKVPRPRSCAASRFPPRIERDEDVSHGPATSPPRPSRSAGSLGLLSDFDRRRDLVGSFDPVSDRDRAAVHRGQSGYAFLAARDDGLVVVLEDHLDTARHLDRQGLRIWIDYTQLARPRSRRLLRGAISLRSWRGLQYWSGSGSSQDS